MMIGCTCCTERLPREMNLLICLCDCLWLVVLVQDRSQHVRVRDHAQQSIGCSVEDEYSMDALQRELLNHLE